MNGIEINDWSVANQQYLTGMIRLLKAQLQHYSNLQGTHASMVEPFEQSTAGREELQTLAENMQAPPAIEKLAKVFGLSSFEKDILLMCAGIELDTGLGELMASIQGAPSFFQPSFGFALATFQQPHWSATSPGAALRYWRLIEMSKTQMVTSSPIKIDEHILHYLAGLKELNEKIKEVAFPVNTKEEPVPSQQRIAELVIKTISNNLGKDALPLIQLTGNDRSDKVTIAGYISRQLHSQLYVISAYAIPSNTKDNMELARTWSREAALNNYVLLLDCMDFDNNDKQRNHSLSSFIENVQGLVLLNSDQWSPELKRDKYVFNTAKPSPEEQMTLWKTELGTYADAGGTCLENIVSQFNLGTDTIRSAASEILSHVVLNGYQKEDGHPGLEKHIWKICCRHTRPQVDELAQRIEPVATWNDIVLPEPQKLILKELSAQVKQRNKVYGKWGFNAKSSRGLGISVLFAGESGTGKTMASEVLANELQLDLYKIDLSKVVNKYIGETEKNLKKIFDAAEDGGAILLFDEADALFGKRSDVKDSHDRYSNIEVSYLLQRMEAYRGLAILTTNMKNALDKAFMRRIRFIINFPFPDSIQRAEIWNKAFPEATPKNSLDIEKLSKLTIPGGSIRNIALNAAFLAADEDRPVQMSHIFRAAKSEYDKIEKPFNHVEIRSWQ